MKATILVEETILHLENMAAESPGGVGHYSLNQRMWNKTRLLWLEGDPKNIKVKEAIKTNREIKAAVKFSIVGMRRRMEKHERNCMKFVHQWKESSLERGYITWM